MLPTLSNVCDYYIIRRPIFHLPFIKHGFAEQRLDYQLIKILNVHGSMLFCRKGTAFILLCIYEQLFLEYHLRFFGRLIEIIIYLVLVSMLILCKLVKICFMFAHRWILIPPEQWLI